MPTASGLKVGEAELSEGLRSVSVLVEPAGALVRFQS